MNEALKIPNLKLKQRDASASVSTEPLFYPQTALWTERAAKHKLVEQAEQQITDSPSCPLTQKAAFFLLCSVTTFELHVRGWVFFYLARIEDAGFLFRGVSQMKGFFFIFGPTFEHLVRNSPESQLTKHVSHTNICLYFSINYKKKMLKSNEKCVCMHALTELFLILSTHGPFVTVKTFKYWDICHHTWCNCPLFLTVNAFASENTPIDSPVRLCFTTCMYFSIADKVLPGRGRGWAHL